MGTKVESDVRDVVEEGKRAPIGRVAVGVITVCLHAVGALVTVLVSIGEPAIGRALGIPEIRDNRLTEAFMAAQVCLLPITGRLIAAWGVAAVLRRCSLGFIAAAIATVAVASSPTLRSLDSLVLLLVLQGMFAAPLTPATQALVVRTYPEAARTRGLALWAIGQYAGFVVGALLAGWIVENVAWQSLFAIAPVVAAIPLPFLRRDLRLHTKNPRALRSVAAGAIVALGICLAVAAPFLAETAVDAARIATGMAALVGLFAFELARPGGRRLPPDLGRASLRTIGDRWFAVAAALTLGVQAFTTGQFEVLLLQGPLDVPAELVSLRTLVGGLTQIGAAAAVGYLLGRGWLRAAIAVSLLVMAVGTATYATYVPGVGDATLLWTRVVVGLGGGAAMPVLATVAFRHLPTALTPQGATIFAVANSLGVLAGLILLDTVFAIATGAGQTELAAYHTIIDVEAAGLLALLFLTLLLRPRADEAGDPGTSR